MSLAARGFVVGWSGGEDEDVVIDDEEEEQPQPQQQQQQTGDVQGEEQGAEIGGLEKADSSCPQPDSPFSSAGGSERETGKRLDARKYRKAFTPGPRMDCPNSAAPSVAGKGKELAVENRRQQDENSAGPSSEKSGIDCDWIHQWVPCSVCKKWRRIPFNAEVERSWQCKDNVWNPEQASCDALQVSIEAAAHLLPETVNHRCMDLTKARSSLEAQLDSLPDEENCAPNETGKSADEPHGVGDPRTSEVDAVQEAGCQSCGGVEGEIISCSGQACNIKYHISCLDPPLTSMPGDAWRCSGCSCAKFSTPALTVESIYKWTSNGETTDEELYYVKWKGRAHIHNTVMSETEVAKLAPKRMSSFKKSILLGKALKWDALWTEPQRVIAKRTTDAQKLEWLVKWNGLGYEQCSWEAADGGVFATEYGELLVARYVRWCETARRFASQPEKAFQKFEKLRSHPDWLKAGHLKQHQFDMLNKLRECWFNRSAGIALCELNKEHIISVTSFVISIFREFNIRLPVLIITSAEMLHYWDRNLTEWDADLNAVIYRGSGEAREVIQRHEFDYIQGWIKINIVVSTFDIVGSDVDFLKGYRWAAVLVDEAHFTKVGKCFFQNIAQLQTDYRLVFSNLVDPCKNNLQDLLQLLSFIDNEEQSLSPCEDDAAQLSEVLERLRRYAVCDCKTEASNNITEFWVPVQMSPVQIHQYCSILSQHYELLRSGSLSQGDMSLHNLVQVLRSCCCHPYLVANALQKSIEEIIPPANYLQIGIRVSGKLELLHKLLLEFHHSKKTVVILVQPRASKLNDILDDYLRQQFGLESYERIQKGMDIQTRQAALQRFNAKDSGRFVLLLERSAAISDKLKSLDAVFIYGSDWNPSYDTSYLQSLGITSKYVVYRFYSCLSIEEKLLANARQGMLMDRNLKAVNSKVLQDILRWDAKVLLQIDDWSFENGASTDPRIGWEQVMEELKKTKDDNRWLNRLIFFDAMEVKLLASGVHGYSDKLQAILTPRQPSVEGSPLYGVPTGDFQDVVSSADEFWSALFGDKCGLPQKVRKHNRDQAGGMKPKKRRKSDIPEDKAAEKELDIDQVEAAGVNDLSEQPKSSVPPCSSEVETTSSARSQGEDQEERHGNIKPELRSLCDVLQLPAEVFERAEEMLDFVMKNLRMSWNFIHELELALCGIAAEQLQAEFDLSEAIAMSSTKLCFEVEESDVQAVWGKLKKQLAVSLPHLFNEKDTGISVATKPSEKEINAALERVKAITRERKTRLLDHQKAEWFRMSRKAEKQKDDLKRGHAVECHRSGSKRDRDVFERIKRHEAELKDLERRQKQIMDELRSRQTTCRLDECRLITSHVEQIKAGIMSGPLPELILSEEQPSTVSEVVSQEPEEQVQLQGPGEVVQSERSDVEAEQDEQHVDQGRENQAHSQHVDQGQTASQVVNQRQETSQHVDQGHTASQVVNRREETLQHVDQGQTASQVVNRREETLQHVDQGQIAPQVVSRRQETSQHVDQGQTSSNINQRQETAQQVDRGRERETNLQQQQVIQQVNVLPSQSQDASVSGQAHQTRRQLIEGYQQQVVRTGGEGPCIEPQRCTVNQSLDFALPAIQVQQDARIQTQRPVIQVEQTQASTGLEQQPAPLQECQSQSRISGPVRQASASCPLATEELKLLKEIEKSKKVHEDEMSRLAKELEAIKRKYEQQIENERTMYLRKNEVLHHHLQKVGAHRRLAEALRQKDKITSFSRPVTPGRNAVARSNSQPSRPQQQPLTDPSMNFYYDRVSDIASWCPPRTAGQHRSEASVTPQPVRNSASNTFPGTSTSQLRASPHFPTSEGIPNSSQGIPYTLCRLESIPPFPAIQNQGSQGRENQTHMVERDFTAVQGRDPPAGTSLVPTASQGGPRSDTFRHLPAASQGRVEQPSNQHFRSIPGGDLQQQQFIISPSSDYITLGQVRADPHQQAQFSPLFLAQQLAVSRNHLPVSQQRVSPTSTSNNNGTFNSSQQTPPVVTRELINSMRASSQTMYTSIGQQALVQGQFQQLQTGIHQQNQHHGSAVQHQHQSQGGMGAALVAQAVVNQQLQQHQIGLGSHQQHQGGGGMGAGVHQQQHHQTGSGGGGGMLQQAAAVAHHLQLQAAAAHYQQHQAGIGAVVHQQQQAGFVHQQQQQQQLQQRTRAVQHPLETPAVFSQNDYICLGDD